MNEPILPKTTKISDVLDAALKNIKQHIAECDNISSCDNLIDYSIPQLQSAIDRLRK